jgi:hypothetical protein
VGKSALALVAAHYVLERHYFADGALVVDLADPLAADFLPPHLALHHHGGGGGGGSDGGEGGALCVFDAAVALANAISLSQTLPDRTVAAAAELRPLLRAMRARAIADAAAAAVALGTPRTPSAESLPALVAPSPPWAAAARSPPPPSPPPAAAAAGAAAPPPETPPAPPLLARTFATPSTGGAGPATPAAGGTLAEPPATAAAACARACEEASLCALEAVAEQLVAPLAAAHCLLVLDNVSAPLRADPLLGRLLSALLRCRRVRLLATCAQPLGLSLAGTAEKVVRLEPLDAHTTARLLVRAAPRPLLRSELERTMRRLQAEGAPADAAPAAAGSSMLQCLARHELVSEVICGMPAKVFALAPRLHALSLDQLAERQLARTRPAPGVDAEAAARDDEPPVTPELAAMPRYEGGDGVGASTPIRV